VTCVRIYLGNGDVMWSCSRGRRKERPPCSVCKSREHTLLCDYVLRGSKAGQTCSAKLCKRAAVNAAEAAGEVADSMQVRAALVARIKAGEITHEQALAELTKIKRGAKAAGKTTRARAWRAG
jgi:hypothetical protein